MRQKLKDFFVIVSVQETIKLSSFYDRALKYHV